MAFRWFWGKTTIGDDGFRWLCTIGPTMEWLCTIVEVQTRSTLLPAKWNSEGGNEENEGFEGDGLGAGKKKRMRRGRQVSGKAEETEKDERLVGAGKALNQTQVFSVERT